jgi:hypothetical protein
VPTFGVVVPSWYAIVATQSDHGVLRTVLLTAIKVSLFSPDGYATLLQSGDEAGCLRAVLSTFCI